MRSATYQAWRASPCSTRSVERRLVDLADEQLRVDAVHCVTDLGGVSDIGSGASGAGGYRKTGGRAAVSSGRCCRSRNRQRSDRRTTRRARVHTQRTRARRRRAATSIGSRIGATETWEEGTKLKIARFEPPAEHGRNSADGTSGRRRFGHPGAMAERAIPTDDELKQKLTPLQYEVTQRAGTERAFSGAYWDVKDPGTYHCIVCDEPLFSSETKYDSRLGVAELHRGDGSGEGHAEARPFARHGPHRGRLRHLRRPPRPRLSRRPRPDRRSVLHELGIARNSSRPTDYTGGQTAGASLWSGTWPTGEMTSDG